MTLYEFHLKKLGKSHKNQKKINKNGKIKTSKNKNKVYSEALHCGKFIQNLVLTGIYLDIKTMTLTLQTKKWRNRSGTRNSNNSKNIHFRLNHDLMVKP